LFPAEVSLCLQREDRIQSSNEFTSVAHGLALRAEEY
jgi:hypothetical protein